MERRYREMVQRVKDSGVVVRSWDFDRLEEEKEFRGCGINLAIGAHSYLGMIGRGYKTASYTVLDDNWPSRRTMEKLGGTVVRNFVVYRKELSPLAPTS